MVSLEVLRLRQLLCWQEIVAAVFFNEILVWLGKQRYLDYKIREMGEFDVDLESKRL